MTLPAAPGSARSPARATSPPSSTSRGRCGAGRRGSWRRPRSGSILAPMSTCSGGSTRCGPPTSRSSARYPGPGHPRLRSRRRLSGQRGRARPGAGRVQPCVLDRRRRERPAVRRRRRQRPDLDLLERRGVPRRVDRRQPVVLRGPDGGHGGEVNLRFALPWVRGDTVIASFYDEDGTIMVKRYRIVRPGEAGR